MRLAVIADIHSNREALDSVLAQIDQEGVEAILNLGDLVGYNASPNECLELLQGRNVWSLAGNHDLALLDPERAQYFNIIAYQALMWSREQIRPEFLEFLQGLPLTREQPGSFLACHGTPTSPDTYIAYHFQGKRVLKRFAQTLRISGSAFSATPTGGPCGTGISGARWPCARSPRPQMSYPRRNTISSTPAAWASPGTATRKRPTPSSTTRSSPSISSPSLMISPGPNAASWPPACPLSGGAPGPGGLEGSS